MADSRRSIEKEEFWRLAMANISRVEWRFVLSPSVKDSPSHPFSLGAKNPKPEVDRWACVNRERIWQIVAC